MKVEKKELFAVRRKKFEDVNLGNITILSNTCLGGRLYHDYNSQFLSPTVDLYIAPDDFVKFCMDLDGYLHEKIKLLENVKVPKDFIPTALGDIRVYFAYSNKDFKTSVYNWDKRKERIVYDNIKCICTDRVTVYTKLGNCGIETIKNYGNIPYDKVFFTVNDYEADYVARLRCFKNEICVPEATRPSLTDFEHYIVESDGFELDSFLRNRKNKKSTQNNGNEKYDALIYGCTLNTNYGSVMTYYALYKVLEEMGINAAVTAKPYKDSTDYSSEFFKKNTKLAPGKNVADFADYNRMSDTFIIGSDQVFNYALFRASYRNSFLFDFADKDKKLISFASSYGFDYSNSLLYGADEYYKVKELMDRFDYMSVREKDGIELSEKEFGVLADFVMDPVFMLNPDTYIELSKKAINKPEKGYITSYFLNANEEYNKLLEYTAEELKLPMVNMITGHPHRFEKQRELSVEPVCENLKMEEWLYNIANSDFVVTNSYHCMCFSIIFRKKFVIIQNSWAPARIVNLLRLFGLSDRLIGSFDEINDKKYLLTSEIDYDAVWSVIKRESEASYEWLRKAIEGDKKTLRMLLPDELDVTVRDSMFRKTDSWVDYLELYKDNSDKYIMIGMLKGKNNSRAGRTLVRTVEKNYYDKYNDINKNLVKVPEVIQLKSNGSTNVRDFSIELSDRLLEMFKENPHNSYKVSFDWKATGNDGWFKIQLAGSPWDDICSTIIISPEKNYGHYEGVYMTKDSIHKFEKNKLQIRTDNMNGTLEISNFKFVNRRDIKYTGFSTEEVLDGRNIQGLAMIVDAANERAIASSAAIDEIQYENEGVTFKCVYQNDSQAEVNQTGYVIVQNNKKYIYNLEKEGVYVLLYSKKIGQVVDIVRRDENKFEHIKF